MTGQDRPTKCTCDSQDMTPGTCHYCMWCYHQSTAIGCAINESHKHFMNKAILKALEPYPVLRKAFKDWYV